MGQHDDWFAQVAQLFTALAEEMAEDAFFDVEQVSDAIGQIAAFDALQRLGIAAYDAADSIFDREMIGADQRLDLLYQGWVRKHQGMGGEDSAVLGAEFGTDRFLVGACLRGSLSKGLAQPLALVVDLAGRNDTLGNAEPLRIQH